MEIAKWDDSFKTGNVTVDLQHQQLFRLINNLHGAILAKRDRQILFPTLEKVNTYTTFHFRSEEALMASVNYPHAAVHKTKHEQLKKEVETLTEKYVSGEAILSITLALFLADWWRHHIKEDDMALASFVQAKRGVRTEEPAHARP